MFYLGKSGDLPIFLVCCVKKETEKKRNEAAKALTKLFNID